MTVICLLSAQDPSLSRSDVVLLRLAALTPSVELQDGEAISHRRESGSAFS